jgi:polyhydroxyalkanoate synthesis regulator phasin
MLAQFISRDEQQVLLQAARKMLLFDIGFLALPEDEIEELLGQLIESGEITKEDGRELFCEVIKKKKAASSQQLCLV